MAIFQEAEVADSPSRALGKKAIGRPRAWGAYLEAPNRFAAGFAKLQTGWKPVSLLPFH